MAAPPFVDVDITISKITGLDNLPVDDDDADDPASHEVRIQGSSDIRVRWEVETPSGVVAGSSPFVPVVSGRALLNFKFSAMHIPMESCLNFCLIQKGRAGNNKRAVLERPLSAEWTVIQLPPYCVKPQSAAISITGLPGVLMQVDVGMKEATFAYSAVEGSVMAPLPKDGSGASPNFLTPSYDPDRTDTDLAQDGTYGSGRRQLGYDFSVDENEDLEELRRTGRPKLLSLSGQSTSQLFSESEVINYSPGDDLRLKLGKSGLSDKKASSGLVRFATDGDNELGARAGSSAEALGSQALKEMMAKCNTLTFDETLTLEEFQLFFNKDRKQKLPNDQLVAFFCRADAAGTGTVTRVNIYRVLFDLLSSEGDLEMDLSLIFGFISNGEPTITFAQLYDVLDDVFSNFSYRSSTSRDTYVNIMVTNIMKTFGNDGTLDEEGFKSACRDPKYKCLAHHIKYLITESTNDEPICVLFDIPLFFVPKVLIPDRYRKAQRDYHSKCVIS